MISLVFLVDQHHRYRGDRRNLHKNVVAWLKKLGAADCGMQNAIDKGSMFKHLGNVETATEALQEVQTLIADAQRLQFDNGIPEPIPVAIPRPGWIDRNGFVLPFGWLYIIRRKDIKPPVS